MRIGIDLTALLPEATGVDVALIGLVRALARVDAEDRFVVLVNREDRPLFSDRLPENFSLHAFGWRPRPVRLLVQQGILPALATALRLDVVHSPSFIQPMVRGFARHLLTVHDLTSFSRPQDHLPFRRSLPYLWAVRASVALADAVTVPSRAARDALARQLGARWADRVHVVPWGVGEEFRPLSAACVDERLRRLGLTPPYLLFVGTIEPRKNVLGILDAYAELVRRKPDAPPLVLAGRLGWGYEPVLAALERPELRDRVRRLGYVAAEDLPALYGGASLFVYPSREEGFGFPPLEAMACGTPTIATAGSSLAENLEGAAELVSADSSSVLADAMARLLFDDALRHQRREQGRRRADAFRWDATARRYIELYRRLGSGAATLAAHV